MFDQVGWSEIAVLLVIALFVFGPERLPTLARDAGRTIRQLRTTLRGMTEDLKTELGPEVGDLDLASLHPKRFVEDLLRDEDDGYEPLPTPPGGRLLAAGERPPYDPDAT